MTNIEISYEQAQAEQQAPEQWVRTTLERILALLGEDECEIGVSFVSDDTIRALNMTYRGLDESTDILSFASGDDDLPFFADDDGLRYLGDLAISLDALKRNALSFSVGVEEELVRLLIHGALHLLGADHQSNDADEPMLIRQEALLAQVRGSER